MTSSGKDRVWSIGVRPNEVIPFFDIVVTTGYIDGAMVEFVTTIKEGKNLGRANATTPHTQAIKEAQAAWEKNKRLGYSESLANFVAPRFPMKAHELDKCLDKLTWPAIAQPKLEGIHCKVVRVSEEHIHYFSRTNARFLNFSYMDPFFREILNVGEEIGAELYAHDTSPLNPTSQIQRIHFEDIVSLIKNPALEADRQKLIKAHCFDLPCAGVPVEERLTELERRISLLPDNSPIEFIPFYEVNSLQEFYELHESFKVSGFEGSMYRRAGSLYEWDIRSYDLLKHKDMIDMEFPIVEVNEGKGTFAGKAVFTCKADNGRTFEVITKGSAEKKEMYLANAFFYIGKAMTVKYQRLTKKGVPYLPVGIMRDYEGD